MDFLLEYTPMAGLSGEERVTEDHSLLDTPEAPQQVQELRHVPLPGKKEMF